MYTHRITTTYQTDAGVVNTLAGIYQADIETGTDTTIAANATNAPVVINWTFSKLKSFTISASGACTIKTNSSSTPTTTLTLAAGQVIAWSADVFGASPIPGDVTGGLFVTNPGATPITLKIRVLTTV